MPKISTVSEQDQKLNPGFLMTILVVRKIDFGIVAYKPRVGAYVFSFINTSAYVNDFLFLN